MKERTSYNGQAVPQLFMRQVARTPNHVALRFEKQALTYKELDERTDRLASYLSELGIQLETLVGICTDTSLDAVVAILGILKAGGAFIFLDPQFPDRRLGEIVRDASCSRIIGYERFQSRFAAASPDWIDFDTALATDRRAQSPGRELTPENLAYVTYTSGSTGSAKGIGLCHESIVNGLEMLPFGTATDDVCSLNSSLAFGFSVSRLFLPLLTGVPLVIVPEKHIADPQALVAVLQAEKVTSLALITPIFRKILDVGPALTTRLQRVRIMTVGGSVLRPDDVTRFIEQFPRTRLLNGYAASEIGGPALVSEREEHEAEMSINRIFPNTSVHIVDEEMNELPANVRGELFVGARRLSRGYLGQPALTAERFRPNPYSNAFGGRLFRTGDVGYRLSNGDIRVLGRTDSQVKIRGYRVDLKDVEAALESNEDVSEAAVTTMNALDDADLIAYVVVKNHSTTAVELRLHTARLLPKYMVPSRIVVIDKMPHTATGKIDLNVLASTDASERPALSLDYVPPRTHTEIELSKIWTEVLGISQVGIYDDFLELGGHSLLAISIVNLAKTAFGREISIPEFLECRNIERLASYIDATDDIAARAGTARSVIRPVARGATLPVSFRQEARLLDELAAGTSTQYRPALCLLFTGTVEVNALERAINEVIQRHEILRIEFRPVASSEVIRVEGWDSVRRFVRSQSLSTRDIRFQQVIRPKAPLHTKVVQSSSSGNENEVDALTLVSDLRKLDFDYAQPPLLKAVISINKDKCLVVIVISHLVSDRWSMDILSRELIEIYEADRIGRTAILPTLPIQFIDFAAWQRQQLEDTSHRETLRDYCEAQFRRFIPFENPDLRIRRPAVAALHLDAGLAKLHIDEVEGSRFRRFASEAGLTLYAFFLGIFSILLYHTCRNRLVTLWIPLANRALPETENLIGWFANDHPFCVDLASDRPIRELLEKTRDCLLAAIRHQHVPSRMIAELMNESNSTTSFPSHGFRVELATPSQIKTFSDLRVERIRPPIKRITTAMRLVIVDSAETGMKLETGYCRDCFDERTIQELLGSLIEIARHAILHPAQSVSSCDYLSRIHSA